MKLLFVLLLLGSSAYAGVKCDRALSKVWIEDPFWNTDKPVLVKTKTGKELPFTFSSDIEIPDAEIYAQIYKDPELFEKFKVFTQWQHLSIKKSAETLRMSKKQFTSFAIRKGVVVNSDEILYSDLYPRYLDQVLPRAMRGHDTIRLEATEKWLSDLPIQVDLDSSRVEIRHNKFEDTPLGFKTFIENVNRRVQQPQTHFHLGIPAAAVTDEQFLAITRALETRAIIRLAIEDPEPQQKLSYSVSYLYDNLETEGRLDFGSRGVVKGQLNAFEGTNPGHDLELREWTTTEQALGEIKLAIALAGDAQKIRIIPGITTAEVQDPLTQNLRGALVYASRALLSSTNPKIVSVAERLQSLIKELDPGRAPTTSERIAIAKFCDENKVLDLLDVEAFRNH